MNTELCPGCQKQQPNVGPWREPGEPSRLCGPCKCLSALRKPGARERIERSLSQALSPLVPLLALLVGCVGGSVGGVPDDDAATPGGPVEMFGSAGEPGASLIVGLSAPEEPDDAGMPPSDAGEPGGAGGVQEDPGTGGSGAGGMPMGAGGDPGTGGSSDPEPDAGPVQCVYDEPGDCLRVECDGGTYIDDSDVLHYGPGHPLWSKWNQLLQRPCDQPICANGEPNQAAPRMDGTYQDLAYCWTCSAGKLGAWDYLGEGICADL